MHSKRNHAFIKAFFFRKNLSNIHYICIKKNHAFINAFSERKSPRFHKCIFSQKKKTIQTYIIYALKKKSCIHKSIFFRKNLSNMHYICIKKNHAFINSFSERKSPRFHKFIFSQKKIIQTYIIYAFKKKSCIHKSIFF